MARQGGRLAAASATLEQRLERGDIVYFPTCPFELPTGDDRSFLCGQRQNRNHKNIALNPDNGRLSGYAELADAGVARLRRLLTDFGNRAAEWLGNLLPYYAAGWRRDRISLRPEEEATRPLRQTARNDLLHIDAFPSRPTEGDRILRLFANINPTEPRVWITSDNFPRLFARFGREVGLPDQLSWASRLRDGVVDMFGPSHRRRSAYDRFMLRFHNFLKGHDAFQEEARKSFWKFPPNSLWLVFTDGVSHAELRGRHALEHSFFVPSRCLALPNEAPAAILSRASQPPNRRKAA